MTIQRNFKLIFSIVILFIASFSTIYSIENTADTKSRQEILNLLQKWTQDFNAKNLEATCGLFAPDLVASYPGSADKKYVEMCSSLKTALSDPDKTYSYEAPKIEQILIQGDIAIVRLIWKLKIAYSDKLEAEVIQEKGLDVFKRQKDGSWKIAISFAYTLSDAEPPAPKERTTDEF